MKLGVLIVCTLFLIGLFCQETFATGTDLGHGIQILSPSNNHSFVLEINELRKILEVEDIKDRHVVVVSIAGAFRQGKSFLLNFFLKFLEAQYKKHDITDWLGERDPNTTLNGFEWASGRKRKTVGIWMWSEIFTHNFVNGEKIAIILLDTQGIFDDQMNAKECTTIFALSTMISSIQCYNIMQNIQEDHLQHLQLFTEYGRLALQQTNEKPFQKLLFIVRDWPFADDIDYGWHGQTLIDEILNGNDGQTDEMRQLRREIKSSFDEIGAFLMPHPGMTVARKKDFRGNLNQIDPDFIKYAKELVQDLFMPENLITKKINGQNVRASDLVQYLEEYINVFNGDTLPEPQPIYEATAKAHNLILSNDCVKSYNEIMERKLNETDPYFKENDLKELHERAMIDAIMKFENTLKLGSDALINVYRTNIENDIEEKFIIFQWKNDEKRNMFIEKANLHNEKTSSELKETFEKRFLMEISKPNSSLSGDNLDELYSNQEFLQQFDIRKMGDEEISSGMREKLENDLNNFSSMVNVSLEVYNDCVNQYNDSMTISFDEIENYFKQSDLINIHQQTKSKLNSQFINRTIAVDERVALIFQQRMTQQIEEQFSNFTLENERKHSEFIKRANDHNEKLCVEGKDKIKHKVIDNINKLQQKVDKEKFTIMLNSSIETAIKEFDTKKLDDGEVAAEVRGKFIAELKNMQYKLLSTLQSYNIYLDKYEVWMQSSINNAAPYFEDDELQELHKEKKNEALTQFTQITYGDSDDVKPQLQYRLENAIDSNFNSFIMKNNDNRVEFIRTARIYNDALVDQLISSAERGGFIEIQRSRSFLDDETLDKLYTSVRLIALRNFDNRKKGDHTVWSESENKFRINLLELETSLKERNTKKRNEYISNEGKKAGYWSLVGGIAGAFIGGIVGGPAGAVAGATTGAAMSGATSGAISVANS